MATLGIVLAVSKNVPPFSSLQPCAKDGEAIAVMLRETGRFDEILTLALPGQTASREAKAQLTAFVDRHKGKPVDEILFFFSGHGVFTGDEFYHVLSDYDESRPSQSGLGNAELDNMLRSLSPTLCVKVVDACYSGVSYVKSEDELGAYLKSAYSGYNQVYFLYSSQNDEKSFTDGDLSAFTRSLLEAVARENQGPIRYNDLVNAARDAFETSQRQKPHFVIQASCTEVFCEASSQMQAALASFLPAPVPATPSTPPVEPTPSSKSQSVIEQVRVAEAACCTREEADAALVRFGDLLRKAVPDRELADLYEITVAISKEEVTEAKAVGDWLEKRVNDGFFARPTFTKVSYKKRVPKRRTGSGILDMARIWKPATLMSDAETELVDAVRDVVSGYSNTTSLPVASATLRLDPRYKTLAPEDCTVAVLVSRTEARVFWSMRHYRYSDWDTAVPEGSVPNWSEAGAGLKDDAVLAALAGRVVQDLMAFTRQRVTARFPGAAASPQGERAWKLLASETT